MLFNKQKATITGWVPILDKPVYLSDIAQHTREFDEIKARAMMMCYFGGLPPSDVENMAHVINLIDKYWGADVVQAACAEERVMLTLMIARALGGLSLDLLAAQFAPTGLDKFLLVGALLELFLDRFAKDAQPVVNFRFTPSPDALLPPYNSRFIECVDILDAVSLETAIEPRWMDVAKMDWEREETRQALLGDFGPLCVIVAAHRHIGGISLYDLWRRQAKVEQGWPGLFALFDERVKHRIWSTALYIRRKTG